MLSATEIDLIQLAQNNNNTQGNQKSGAALTQHNAGNRRTREQVSHMEQSCPAILPSTWLLVATAGLSWFWASPLQSVRRRIDRNSSFHPSPSPFCRSSSPFSSFCKFLHYLCKLFMVDHGVSLISPGNM